MKKKYVNSILGLLLLILATGCAAPTAPLVTRVIDGDTIEVDIAGTIYKVRYIGIDTPELDDKEARLCDLAQKATRLNRQLVEEKTVRLEKDVSETDEYGRLLRYVYVDDILVNAKLVRHGLAWAKTYPPDIKYQDYLMELEQQARQDGIGIWDMSKPQPIEIENVEITYIFYDGLAPRVESDEYVEITNVGDQPQELTGCILTDISEGYPHSFFHLIFWLQAKASESTPTNIILNGEDLVLNIAKLSGTIVNLM